MSQLNRIQFVCHPTAKHRRHYANENDVKVVLSRLPPELWARVKEIHFSDDSECAQWLGNVSTKGRREINLCALPLRVSLRRIAGKSAEEFGAITGSQWPTLAVRRFQLYDTLLHEIGHLQIIYPKAANPNRKFADEPKAEEFADFWRKKLWSRHFDHPDPVHNPPSKQEIKLLKAGWIEAHQAYKKGHKLEQSGKLEQARSCYLQATELYPHHTLALERLEVLAYLAEAHDKDAGTLRQAEMWLQRTLNFDPLLLEAGIYFDEIKKLKDRASVLGGKRPASVTS
jgi:tetratricopeptide (TPR) repeat protein